MSAPVKNRRVESRSCIEPEGSAASLRFQGSNIPVLILDESMHGASVVLVEPMNRPIEADDEVTFSTAVRAVPSRVAHVSRIPLGESSILRLGLEMAD
jgi:hypothetical protein